MCVSHFCTSSICTLKETVAGSYIQEIWNGMNDSQRYRFNLYVVNNVVDMIVFLAERCLILTISTAVSVGGNQKICIKEKPSEKQRKPLEKQTKPFGKQTNPLEKQRNPLEKENV